MTTMIQTPAFITQELTPYDIASINQGGCASGAYMPAVTYSQALETMTEHGDDVFDYLEGVFDLSEAPTTSWGGMACFYLSTAVELWCSTNSHLGEWNNQPTLTDGYAFDDEHDIVMLCTSDIEGFEFIGTKTIDGSQCNEFSDGFDTYFQTKGSN